MIASQRNIFFKNHLIARLALTLYKNPTYHNWNQFTALEDDLSRVIQIS